METHKAKIKSRDMKHKKGDTELSTMENQQFTEIERNQRKRNNGKTK